MSLTGFEVRESSEPISPIYAYLFIKIFGFFVDMFDHVQKANPVFLEQD